MVVSGLAAIVAWGQQWSVATTHGDRSGAETAATTPAPSVPPLGSLMLSQPLAGFAVAPPGPSDGPLTASEFASQSSDPTQAEARFEALAAQPGFDAYIRLWTEKDRSGQVANDMACLLFRIPHLDDAGSFADDLAASFAGSPGVAPFDVPGIAGGRGYTVEVTAPVRASEEIIVFRSGPYVSMVQLASVASVANGSALTSNQAIAVSQRQFAALSPGVRAGTVPVAVGQSGPVPGGGRPGGASSSTRDDLVPSLPRPSWPSLESASSPWSECAAAGRVVRGRMTVTSTRPTSDWQPSGPWCRRPRGTDGMPSTPGLSRCPSTVPRRGRCPRWTARW